MRSKFLKNNRIGNFTNGNPINSAREVPILNETQQQQAALVRKLPKDFPIAGWESMNTKQQLQAIKFSGLNAQEQWSLLNANEKLSTLSQYNQAQTQNESTALAARVAASLVNAKAQAAVGKPTVSTSLQNAALNGQLGGSVDALSASLKATSSPNNTLEQKSGSRSAKLGGSILSPTRTAGQSPAPTPTPTPSQTSASASSPNETPQPEPAPSPETTPNVGGSTQNNGANEVTNAETAYQRDPIEYLFGIDTTYLSEESRNRLYYISRKFYGDGVVPPGLYSSYLSEIGRIKEEMKSNQEAQKLEQEKAEYFNIVKSGASADTTWGTEMIYDQSKYPRVDGTFGLWGNLPEKMCGIVAIQDVNNILGIKTRLDNQLFWANKYSVLTTNAFGALGVNPLIIKAGYEAAGMKVTFYTDPSKIPNGHDAYIVLFGHPTGGHYVAASYDSDKDVFLVYNNFKKSKAEEWSTLTPSAYAASAFAQKQDGRSYGWFVWGIDKPKQPIVKKTGPTAGKAGRWLKMIK